MNYKRHPDDEIADNITLRVVPRFKESSLSGSEWRISVELVVRRKGVLIYERAYNSMEDAVSHLPWLLRTGHEGEFEFVPLGDDVKKCFQPGCGTDSTRFVRLKKEYSREGFVFVCATGDGYVRGFCDEHRTRGDCGLEDADTNYETVRPEDLHS